MEDQTDSSSGTTLHSLLQLVPPWAWVVCSMYYTVTPIKLVGVVFIV